jgi:hypothetical protein
VLWPKIGHVGPTCQASWPCNLEGQPSFLLAPPLVVRYLEHHLWSLDTLSTASPGHIGKMVFENTPTHGWSAKVMWLAGPTLARLKPCFVPGHFLMSYCL